MKTIKNYSPYVVVFLSSMSVMIVELVASRIISKYFGNSLYTWTGIIGVVLGGISLGNFLGGRLADRFEPARIIRPLLAVSALLVVLILALDTGLMLVMKGGDPVVTWGFLLRVISVIVLLFFLPSTALGTISPVMAKYALLTSTTIGSTVGGIYAVSSIGSILGTFLSGFLLIPLLGIRLILVFVSAVLLTLALFAPGRRLKAASSLGISGIFGIVILTTVWTGATLRAASGEILMEKDTRYSYIAVHDTTSDSIITERVLIMDGLIHNRYDPRDPDRLLYDYERLFRALTEHHQKSVKGQDGLRTLTVGGGALTFPSYLERHFSMQDNTVAEIDPDVIRTAFEWFDIPRDTKMNIVPADGRNYIQWAEANGKTYDIVYIDAFSSYSVPYHLTTEEFLRTVSGTLAPDGMLLVNVIDIFSIGRFLNAFVNSVESVYPETAVYVTPSTSLESRSTFVVAALRAGTLPGELVSAGGLVEGRRLPQEQLDELRQRNGTRTLTDFYAPVEGLIAPVFIHSVD